jgi:predicted HTH domain antitoxin
MQITLNLPDELVQHFNRDHLAREILEALVIQAYQVEKITSAEVGRILELPSRWAVDDFLKQQNANLHYDETDLEQCFMIVVSDTSPINYLLLINQIDLLPRLFQQIIVPDVVRDEMVDPSAPLVLQNRRLGESAR